MNFKNILSLLICLLISNNVISQDSSSENKGVSIKDFIKTPKKLSKKEINLPKDLKNPLQNMVNLLQKMSLKKCYTFFHLMNSVVVEHPSKGQDLATDFLKEKYINLGILPARKIRMNTRYFFSLMKNQIFHYQLIKRNLNTTMIT